MGYLSVVVLLVVGLIGVGRFRGLSLGLRYLVGLIGFGLVVELAAHLLLFQHRSNLLLIPVDAAGELWLLSLVYAHALQWPVFMRVRPWVAGSFVLYAGLSGVLLPETARFKPVVQVIESLLVLGMVWLYFRKLLNELQVLDLVRDPMFWVSSGLLLYCLGKVQIVLFSNYLLLHYSLQLNLAVWDIHALLTVGLYYCYGRALWMHPQK